VNQPCTCFACPIQTSITCILDQLLTYVALSLHYELFSYLHVCFGPLWNNFSYSAPTLIWSIYISYYKIIIKKMLYQHLLVSQKSYSYDRIYKERGSRSLIIQLDPLIMYGSLHEQVPYSNPNHVS
jgi:hypothetical protein